MSIIEVVKARLGEPTGSGEWVCPFCTRYGAVGLMAVRLEPPVFYCPTCGHGGNAIKFVSMFDRISIPQAQEKLAGADESPAPNVYKAPDVVARPRFTPELFRGKRSSSSTS